MVKRIFLFSGLFLIVILGSIGGYFAFQTLIEQPTGDCGDLPEDQICLDYNQWKHTTNSVNANFSIYETNPTKVILFDASSIDKISATLKFVKIPIGEMKLYFETFGEPLLYYPNEMTIDFKSSGEVIFSLHRQKYGSYIFEVDDRRAFMMDNTLSKLELNLNWDFTKKIVQFQLKRLKGWIATEPIYTKTTGIDEIHIYTTSSTVNSGTLFYFDDSYLKILPEVVI